MIGATIDASQTPAADSAPARPTRIDLDISLAARSAQVLWAVRPIASRLKVLREARMVLARMATDLAEAIPATLARTHSDTLAAEVLPLLAACKFLECEAAGVLKPRRLGRKGLPFWLGGIESSVERVPFGIVLIIGPANYPLFLPGVQTLQALAAGNAVVWKPGTGGRAVAEVFAAALDRAGLPAHLLRIADDTVEAAENELASGPDKVIFTGSAHAARAVLAIAARTLTPCVVEASGCDAVVALPSADSHRVVEALAFGMRLNGSATCMAPRRLLAVGDGYGNLSTALLKRFAEIEGVAISDASRRRLRELTLDAQANGAEVFGDLDGIFLRPVLVLNGRPEMRIARADVFAPVLTVIPCANEDAVLAAQRTCPFGLTVAIFGDPAEAQALGARMNVGTVIVNDLIVPTADPRVPFGGRRGSGFGTTRGREGLLEMTAAKAILVRNGKGTRHYATTTVTHQSLFEGVIAMSHAATWRERWNGLRKTIEAAGKLK